MIHSYVIGRGNTATAYLQAGKIRPFPATNRSAVVDVQSLADGRRVPTEQTSSSRRAENRRLNADRQRGSAEYIWEGNNLNKISKKIVSLVTVAAFATTLVPAAAFAADGTLSAENTKATIADTAANQITVNLDLYTQSNLEATTADLGDATLKVALEGKTGTVYTDITAEGDGLTGASTSNYTSVASTGLELSSINATELEYVFNEVPAGTYNVKFTIDNGTVAEEEVTLGQVTVVDGTVDVAKSSIEVTTAVNGLTVKTNLNDAYGNPATVANSIDAAKVKVNVSDLGNTVTLKTKNFKDPGAATGVSIDELEKGVSVNNSAATQTAEYENVTAGKKTVSAAVDIDGDGTAADYVNIPVAYVNGATTAVAAPVAVTVDDAAQANVSRLLIDNQEKTADATEGTAETVEFDLNAPLTADQHLYLYAQSGDKIVDVIEVTDLDGHAIAPVSGQSAVYDVTGDVEGVKVTFVSDGTYVLYGAIGGTTFAINTVDELQPITVTVAPKAFETAAIALDAPVEYVNTNTDGNVSYWTYTINDNVTPNGQKEYTVTGTAYALNGTERVAAENETLTITTQNDNLKLVDKEVKTDAKGNFEFSFKITDTGVGYITIGEPTDQVYANLKVVQNAMAPVSISTAKDGGIMLAGTDDQYVYNQYAYFNDAVQFNIKDAYDRDATGDEVLALVVAANKNATNHADFVEVDAPEGSKLTDNDIVLAWNNGAYTLQYVGNDPVHDLIPGEYTVSVSLNNGVDATATFTLAEFQGAESLAVDLVAADNDGFFVDDANNDAITAIDDQVALGQYVGGTVYLVDEQGLKVVAPATNLSVGVKGAAVDMKTVDLNNPFGFKTFDNTPANQSVIGSVITISAYDEVNKIYTEKELTVVSNYLEETLAFDPVQGPVGENNAVEISVVDKDGKVSKVNGTVTAYVESQSNEEATVELKANETVTDGVGRLYLESDAAGTADVVVAVKATNGEVYAATLTYTFGDEAAADGRYIVMTIGSEQYLINNEIFDGSVDKLGAPYIDDAWRTMVPVRVLAETLGAEVEYADNVVTVVDGDTTVEMTIGEKAYTINGEAAEAEMDTVPVIGDGDRTYVPIRFLTNALGYEVNPLYNAEGLTSSVHFTK